MLPSLIAVAPLAFSGRASSYPGAAWLAPRIHHSPDCLHKTGWHDVAGALTFKGTHHVFQGCPASGGWSHASSTDLVHWKDLGLGPVALNETFAGMESDITPCSGFAAVNDDGVPCAGFRQCGSSKGTTELNPAAHAWDVPMEVRCATNELLTTWSVPQWWNPIYYYRASARASRIPSLAACRCSGLDPCRAAGCHTTRCGRGRIPTASGTTG